MKKELNMTVISYNMREMETIIYDLKKYALCVEIMENQYINTGKEEVKSLMEDAISNLVQSITDLNLCYMLTTSNQKINV